MRINTKHILYIFFLGKNQKISIYKYILYRYKIMNQYLILLLLERRIQNNNRKEVLYHVG